eukprot:Blabericola_migrator_1__4345@NODE_2339_length_2914_cov_65_114155_g682_i2_p1_GENE_NODE_2339_length_2914_cov_65_114155_g682_i2NODE_2339_length_2914_cov_65_114155_g682_i2_p1_ORF_typecomplete_len489_score84_09CWC25/PF12542_8/6_7e03CWC25/PF12542_8/1_5e13CWC25/PF12542_8/3_9e03CWC25/PF12542_8/6_3e03Cir_N/PF10197_9/3_3e10Cir_N/PF10197_9/5_7e03Cir_N/PF10197_9/1_8e04Cir_N/PF10197_9/2_2e03Cir_N/PF10197_9/1e04_NODE_2339_length_2914_cov_65_114155_g682_i29422408
MYMGKIGQKSAAFINHKPFHPGSYRNLEKVWIAEQTHAANLRKQQELLDKRQQESRVEELRRALHQSGLNGSKEETEGAAKLEWMYRSTQQLEQDEQEAYLLGAKELPTAHNDEVDRIKQIKDEKVAGALLLDEKATPELNKDDLLRKMREDPMFAIRQAEVEFEKQKKTLDVEAQLRRLREELEASRRKAKEDAEAEKERLSAKKLRKASTLPRGQRDHSDDDQRESSHRPRRRRESPDRHRRDSYDREARHGDGRRYKYSDCDGEENVKRRRLEQQRSYSTERRRDFLQERLSAKHQSSRQFARRVDSPSHRRSDWRDGHRGESSPIRGPDRRDGSKDESLPPRGYGREDWHTDRSPPPRGPDRRDRHRKNSPLLRGQDRRDRRRGESLSSSESNFGHYSEDEKRRSTRRGSHREITSLDRSATNVEPVEPDGYLKTFEELERERRREIEREFRLERAGKKGRKMRLRRERDLDEQIALGQLPHMR